jgi:voltage-gated potassium channel Kch
LLEAGVFDAEEAARRLGLALSTAVDPAQAAAWVEGLLKGSGLLLLHLVEMTVWAAAFVIVGMLPDFETALYFSLKSYTTVGYGDVLPPQAWRLVGPLEAAAHRQSVHGVKRVKDPDASPSRRTRLVISELKTPKSRRLLTLTRQPD